MKKYNIEYSKESKKDLIGIKQYIKYNLQEPKIANKLISNTRKSTKNLKDNPEIYTIIDDDMIRKLEIRKFIVDNYIIFYRIKNDSIEIGKKIISNLAKESNEPIYITKNGEGDMVLMSIEAYEKREQLLHLRAKVLQAEQERIDGAPTMSVAEARKKLRERLSEL